MEEDLNTPGNARYVELQDAESVRLTATVASIPYEQESPERWPLATRDLGLACSYATHCRKLGIGPLHGIICCAECSSPDDIPPPWLGALARRAKRLGVDVAMPNGTYSFIDSVWNSGGELGEFLHKRLNANGLFDVAEDANIFVEMYRGSATTRNLEDINLGEVMELWMDPAMTNLEAICKDNLPL